MALPTVAIVIPTRNRTELLKRCLGRLTPCVRSKPACSIVVSDDGDAQQTAIALAAQFPHVRVVQGPRRGPAANRNFGAAQSTGELIVFLDDDCIPDENLLTVYREAAAANPQAGVFEGRISSEGAPISFADAIVSNETGGYLWSCNFAVRRTLFDQLNGFDERYPFAAMEDVDFHLRVKKRTRIPFLPQARVWHQVEQRPGWRIVQHQALSILLFMHLHGLRETERGPIYFLRGATRRLIYSGFHHLRTGAARNPLQLAFIVWVNLQLAIITGLWGFRRTLARIFFPACCPSCTSVHALLCTPRSMP